MRNKLWLQTISFFLLFQYSKFTDTYSWLYARLAFLVMDTGSAGLYRRVPQGNKHKTDGSGEGSKGRGGEEQAREGAELGRSQPSCRVALTGKGCCRDSYCLALKWLLVT